LLPLLRQHAPPAIPLPVISSLPEHAVAKAAASTNNV